MPGQFQYTDAQAAMVKRFDLAIIVLSAFGFLIIMVPFICNARAKHLALCTLIMWLIMSNIFNFVNAIIWSSEDTTTWWSGVGLCDIEGKLLQPIFVGIPCSLMVIAKNLAIATRGNMVFVPNSDRKRRIVIDCFLLYFFPALQLGFHYFVQTSRYWIIAVSGCSPAQDHSWPTLLVMFIPPQIFTLGTCYFCGEIAWRMYQHSSVSKMLDQSSFSSMEKSKFWRSYLMAAVIILCYLPISLFLFYENVKIPFIKYDYFAIHDWAMWSVPVYVPFDGVFSIDHLCTVLGSVAIAAFDGFSHDCVRMYRTMLVGLGMGYIWPSLRLPYFPKRRGSNDTGTGGIEKWSPITWLKRIMSERTTRIQSTRLDDPSQGDEFSLGPGDTELVSFDTILDESQMPRATKPEAGTGDIEKWSLVTWFKKFLNKKAARTQSTRLDDPAQADESSPDDTELVSFDTILDESQMPKVTKPKATYSARVYASRHRMGSRDSDESRMEEGSSRIQVKKLFGIKR